MRSNVDWEGRYSRGYYHWNLSSSSRGPYHYSRSPKPYSKLEDRSGWWSKSKEDWSWPKAVRYEEWLQPIYSDDQYDYDYDAYDCQSGRRPLLLIAL